MRAVQAANPDIVFVAAYPPDTVGIVRAAAEIGLTPKMFGGTMIGLLITPIKTQLGPLLDGIVIMESFVPAPNFNFPGVTNVLKRYQAKPPAKRSTRSVTALCRSAVRRDRCWRRRWKPPKASITRDSPTTFITTLSTPWSARSIMPLMAPGRSRARCSRKSRWQRAADPVAAAI
jgi:hypothetical protein